MRRALALLLIVSCPVWGQEHEARSKRLWNPQTGQPDASWINVKNFGAQCDGVTDDTPAVAAAVAEALARPQYQGAIVVYFPPCALPNAIAFYDLKTPLTLPQANRRITLYFDNPVLVEATITVHGGYSLVGTEGGNPGFGFTGCQFFEVGHNVGGPVMHIQAAGMRAQDICFGGLKPGSDGILIDSSSDIRLENVNVAARQDNPQAVPLTISGGFRYEILGGSYGTNPGAAPSIRIEDDTTCSSYGLVRIEGVFLVARGIELLNRCGAMGDIFIDHVLTEVLSQQAFLTAIVFGGAPIFGVELKDVSNADTFGTPLPALIDVQAPNGLGTNGFAMANVRVIFSGVDGLTLTTGAPIWNLEIWSAFRDYQDGILAQPDHFVFHGPHGIKDTMPRI